MARILTKGLFTRRESNPSARVTPPRGVKIAQVYKQNLIGRVTLSLGSTILQSAKQATVRENCRKLACKPFIRNIFGFCEGRKVKMALLKAES